jgi:hypothetical protein
MRVCLTFLLLCGCSVFKDGTASGRVESKGELGAWTLEQGKCFSGQRENYFGAIAYGPDGSGIAIKLVKDSVKGWQAVVNQPETCKGAASACKAVVLPASACKTLDVTLETTNTTVNDVKVIEGKATFDCESGNDSLKGSLVFDHCH